MKNALLLLVILFSFHGFSQTWKTNIEEAEKEATLKNKPILLVFSGSDWCGPCIKLDKTVWQSEEFKRDEKNWVLLKADFPKKKANQLSPELTKSNNDLAEKYNKEGVFPLVVILDAKGKVIAMTSYENISPELYIENLHELDKR
jgi:thioredoxin-related protein